MEDRGPQLAAVAIAFLAIAWLFVSIRIYIRGWMIRSFGTDDWLMILALVLFTLLNAFVLIGVSHGTGQHMSALTPQQITAALRAWWFCEIFYVLCTGALKFAIGAFLLRVTIKKRHNFVIYGILTLSAVYTVYFVFLVMFQCNPIQFWWTRVGSGHCVSPVIMANSTYALSAITALSDWTFGILPAFIVHDLQMNRRMKISVGILLAIANIGSLATLIRIKYIRQLAVSQDFLFATTNIAIWSSIEPGIGIAAASAATYRPLFRSFFAGVDSVRQNSNIRAGSRTNLNSAGYRRTQSMYDDTRPELLDRSRSTRISAGSKTLPSLPAGERRWHGLCHQERYEMDEGPWKVKKTMEVATFETREV